VLTYLMQDEPPEDMPAGALADLPPGRSDWWDFERRRRPAHDPTHPAALWVAYLLPGGASMTVPCPRCGKEGSVPATVDHMLRHHDAGYHEAAAWLEAVDADLFALAIHYLATKARAGG
jgi:hypothetical protein